VELSRREGYSEMQAYCVDLETNTRSVKAFTVEHTLEVKGTIKRLTSPRDIYEKTANEGARRMRATILAVIPADIVELAVETIENTAKQMSPEEMKSAVERMPALFLALGVSVEMLEQRIGKKIAQATIDDVVDLRMIYQSLKEKQSSLEDWFTTENAEVANILLKDATKHDNASHVPRKES
jgi:FtsZ-binding cell division protein ZapB